MKPEYTPNESALQEAHSLVYGDRGTDYSHPHDDYSRTVAIFNAMTGRDLTVEEGVKFMIAVKLSRDKHSPQVRDHLVDLAGYTECLRLVREHENRTAD